MAAGCVRVRINRLLEQLGTNSVVMCVSAFVQQPGQTTLGSPSGFSSQLLCAQIFFSGHLPGGI